MNEIVKCQKTNSKCLLSRLRTGHAVSALREFPLQCANRFPFSRNSPALLDVHAREQF